MFLVVRRNSRSHADSEQHSGIFFRHLHWRHEVVAHPTCPCLAPGPVGVVGLLRKVSGQPSCSWVWVIVPCGDIWLSPPPHCTLWYRWMFSTILVRMSRGRRQAWRRRTSLYPERALAPLVPASTLLQVLDQMSSPWTPFSPSQQLFLRPLLAVSFYVTVVTSHLPPAIHQTQHLTCRWDCLSSQNLV